MVKCIYCNRKEKLLRPLTVGKEQTPVECCSEECAEKTRAFFAFFDRTKPLFFIGIGLSMALIFCSAVILTAVGLLPGGILMGAAFAVLGITALLFPFATPQTFAIFGIRKTLWLTRGLGLFCILIAPLIALLLINS